ncbi:TPA: right-handed parallel beta-helix repeat-containing protein [Pseudomonas aeruginosa]|uniref:right-handed parallel beta-helix repeat-containing protein n=1 Tax=Pseudomonas aeruginosa TaxID=287 RepID=UPI001A254BC1|nr:right-handed parallel beta-helix repeat-containing protein [Pseudomonas aeruginosa]MBH9440718.1 right-handed parallel beta-helix repeat-containing protein [Pseudomonas aeruginosa]MCS8109633.1 right-handed parallel beta-helix repeat-containing protein [Pseudomonas aeruginosa]MCS8763231.1 right-handed parallel beta-helix repeat-containing protein [Pseudomonas aeruginosa]MCS8929504.1 right-handed parallel beta-helix repeat-containing protein [Pseudomonas aeruginosa]HBP4946799.1 right-handed pa
MAYDTGAFPLGSKDPRVLYNNAENMDVAMNSVEQERWMDRGPQRPPLPRWTYWGMEQNYNRFISNSAWELPPLVYVDGSQLTVERSSQVIERDGNLYSVKLPASFPVELSGTWSADEPLLVFRSDQSLRQELAGQDRDAVLGWKRRQLSASIDTIYQLADSIPIRVWEFAELVSDKPSADPSTWNWTPAFQALISAAQAAIAATGKPVSVFIGPGKFQVTSVQMFSDIHVFFGGAEIVAHPSSVDALRIFDARGELNNLGFYGPGTINGNKDSFDVNHRQHGIALVADNVIVRDLTIINIGSTPVTFSMGDAIIIEPTIPDIGSGFQCKNIMITGCTFRNIERQCITLESGINVRVIGNAFYDSTYSAVDLENAGTTIGDIDGFIFANNYVENVNYGVTSVSALQPNSLRNVLCIGNIYKNVIDAYNFRACTNVKVVGCIATGVSRYGVFAYSDSNTQAFDIEVHNFTCEGGTHGIRAQRVGSGQITRMHVKGNKIKNTSVAAIAAEYTAGLVINSNEILVNAGRGISVTACASPDVSDNRVLGAVAITGNAITFDGATTNPVQGGNTITNFSVGISCVASPVTNITEKAANIFTNVATPYSASVGTYWKGKFRGSFTMAAAASMNVPDVRINTASAVNLIPMNAAAASLDAGSKKPWGNPAASSNNSQIRIQTADGGAAAGTEVYKYEIIND